MASHTAPTHKREIERAKTREIRPAHMKLTGRPTEWTPKLLGDIVAYVSDVDHMERTFLSFSDTAAHFGLNESTLAKWYRAGLENDDDSPLRAFALNLARARVGGRASTLKRVTDSKDPRMALELLARVDPHNYSEKRIHAKVQHEHTHSVEHSIDSVTESLIRMLHGGPKDEDKYIDVTPRDLDENS